MTSTRDAFAEFKSYSEQAKALCKSEVPKFMTRSGAVQITVLSTGQIHIATGSQQEIKLSAEDLIEIAGWVAVGYTKEAPLPAPEEPECECPHLCDCPIR